ncbi:MAG: FG-GAP-like repeat-containing protein [Bifidobacteriaceae bacterium]|jgi:hypothetical protein|nr:FG-GAP-like repeat-containing protein [Bifidobacteriaceae bacterium]
MDRFVNRSRWFFSGALCLGLATLGAVVPMGAASAGPPVLVAPRAGDTAADPEAVADAVSQALAALPDDPIAVKPDQDSAPQGEAPAQPESDGVAVLDAAPVGEAALSLDQPAGEVAVLVTDALATDEFSIAGVTWEGDQEPGRVLARAYQNDEWTEWFDLEQADGPDPDSAEGKRAKAGTGPLVVAGSTAIQIEVLSEPGEELPEGVAAAVVPLSEAEIDPDPSAAGQTDLAAAAGSPGSSVPGGANRAAGSATGTTVGGAVGGATSSQFGLAEVGVSPAGVSKLSGQSLDVALGAAPTASAPKPTINLRSSWNAAAPKAQPEVAPKVVGSIIHHQEGTNTYTQAQVPGIIRSIQSWHMGNNGWDDIGYNFLVDKYGGIWEGRQGGVDKNVVGAHAFEFNTGSTGVCFLGSMESAEPSAAALDAAGRLVAWRLGLAGLTTLKGNTVYPKDSKKQSKPIVAGHRDVNATTCPGRYLYAKLDTIRGYSPGTAPVKKYAQVVITPDMNRDGRADLLTVDQSGKLFMFPMASATKLGEPRQIGWGWTGFTLLAPGDWNGDGTADLMSVNPQGKLILYANDGNFNFTSKQVGWGWNDYIARPSADLDGDGCRDLLAIHRKTQDLYLYRGDCKGGFKNTAGRWVGGGWGGWTLHAAGDLTGDKLGDILGLDSSGQLYSYRSVSGGGFARKQWVGGGWDGWDLMAGGDLTGDGIADIVGLNKAERFVNLYRGYGNGGFLSPPLRIATDW